ncbi:hypothetical protein HPQ64_06615 [Rhizobiales bacterium]|uniref:hypothetical protein n=1 Tax=Hongsoonwoonella zoysiae TaxID=2821844 RepID=UPI00155FF737|nr:hypothetical protein [Hongsoonwoonella zoysiae]NRG17354.1 hypothetical protein [Hongsoonwoonella zoysiae]
MRKDKLKSIIKKSVTLSNSTDNLIRHLAQFENENGQPFNTKKPIPNTDSSVSQIVSRIQSCTGLIAEFENATRFNLTPLEALVNLEQSLDQTKVHIDRLVQQVVGIKQAHGGLRTFDYSNFNALANNNNNINIHAYFNNVYNTTEDLLKRLFENLFILKPKSSYSFQAAANSLTSLINDTYDKFTSLDKTLKQLSITEKELISKNDEASNQLDEIKRFKTDSDNDRQTIAEYLSQATSQKTDIQTIQDEASELQATVNDYQETFNQFQKQLDNRNNQFAVGERKFDEIINKFEEQNIYISNLVRSAEDMMSKATVAGLASNFKKMSEQLTSELQSARRAFYVGIIFLTFSALPLFVLVVLPLITLVIDILPLNINSASYVANTGEAQNGWAYLSKVLGRIAILLPAGWFVSFAAIRHSSLFRLREHYAYKYSMAVAVEGFKQQAPQYEQEIAALVLEQLAFNPADKLVPSKEIKEGKIPGIGGFLLDKIRKKVEPNTHSEPS